MKIKKILTLSLAALLTLSLAACGGKKEATVVKVGVVGSNNEQWDTVNKLLEKDNITIGMSCDCAGALSARLTELLPLIQELAQGLCGGEEQEQ